MATVKKPARKNLKVKTSQEELPPKDGSAGLSTSPQPSSELLESSTIQPTVFFRRGSVFSRSLLAKLDETLKIGLAKQQDRASSSFSYSSMESAGMSNQKEKSLREQGATAQQSATPERKGENSDLKNTASRSDKIDDSDFVEIEFRSNQDPPVEPQQPVQTKSGLVLRRIFCCFSLTQIREAEMDKAERKRQEEPSRVQRFFHRAFRCFSKKPARRNTIARSAGTGSFESRWLKYNRSRANGGESASTGIDNFAPYSYLGMDGHNIFSGDRFELSARNATTVHSGETSSRIDI